MCNTKAGDLAGCCRSKSACLGLMNRLQYLNGKAAYVENIWNVINWKTAETRFTGGREDVFKVLKASI